MSEMSRNRKCTVTSETKSDDEGETVTSKAESSMDTMSIVKIVDKLSSKSGSSYGACSSKSVVKPDMCYCGKVRNLNIVELLCANCNTWFHESCIGYQIGQAVPFMMNYIFFCKRCSPTCLEIFKKNQATIPQLCVSAVGNLMQATVKAGRKKEYFSKDSEIVPFIDRHWEGMTTNPRRVTQSWHATVSRTLSKETTLFHSTCKDMYGLRDMDLTHIKPNYAAMIKSGHLRITDDGIRLGMLNFRGRGAKGRKAAAEGSNAASSKRARVEPAPIRLSVYGYPMEYPFNKDSYRYFFAEVDPHAPAKKKDETPESAGMPIPGWLYRPFCHGTVLIALHDRAPQLRVTDDRLSITGEKGYSLARATHYVVHGMWYYEVTVTQMKDNCASRIGWAQPYANLQTPLGFDKFGYSWRSRKGTAFHEARGIHFSEPYVEGDVLGLLIKLPKQSDVPPLLPPSLKDKPLVKFRNHLYFEETDNIPELTKDLKILPGSEIICFKNGRCEGVAHKDLFAGPYYPAVSLYKSCILTLNFGPDFKHPPPTAEYPYRPMCDRVQEAFCEQAISDAAYLAEHGGELKLE